MSAVRMNQLTTAMRAEPFHNPAVLKQHPQDSCLHALSCLCPVQHDLLVMFFTLVNSGTWGTNRCTQAACVQHRNPICTWPAISHTCCLANSDTHIAITLRGVQPLYSGPKRDETEVGVWGGFFSRGPGGCPPSVRRAHRRPRGPTWAGCWGPTVMGKETSAAPLPCFRRGVWKETELDARGMQGQGECQAGGAGTAQAKPAQQAALYTPNQWQTIFTCSFSQRSHNL